MPVVVVNPTGVVFLPSGMTKNGSFAIQTSYTIVTTWTANTGTYPGSTVSSNGLVVQGGKSGASVQGSLRVSNSVGISLNCTLRLILNGNTGSPLQTGTLTAVGALGAATVTVSATGVSLVNGDVLTLYALGSSAGLTTTTDAASFMTIT